jgi:hypothetical protein
VQIECSEGRFEVAKRGRGPSCQGKQALRKPLVLADLAKSKGVVIPAGFRLLDVISMSADGRSYAGNATNPRGDAEGFLLFLSRAP